MARSIRDIISLLETIEKEQELDEAGAGPSRIVRHIRNGNVFIMLSAMRGELKHSENMLRTQKLKQMLTKLPVSFIATEGEYHELGKDGPSPEKSFFVMPDRGANKMTPEMFRNFGIKLMHAFDQDSILYGDGKLASLIFDNGTTVDLGDTLTFRPEVIDTLGGFSKIRGRKFSFTAAPDAAKPVRRADGTAESPKTTGVQIGKVA